MKNSGALIGLLAGGTIFIGAIAFGVFWILTPSGTTTVAETESSSEAPSSHQGSPLESSTPSAETDHTEVPSASDASTASNNDPKGGNNSQYREPPPSPDPPVWNPRPSGEGDNGESIPPAGPTYDLSAEMERVHRDVSATARLPLSLFR